MPDLSNPIAGLYPQPPQPQQNALSADPLRMMSMILQLQQNARAQEQFNANRAMGAAAINNLDPKTGLLNVPGFAGAARNNPSMALAGADAANLATAQAGNQYDLNQKRMNDYFSAIGSLATNKELDYPTVQAFNTDYLAAHPDLPATLSNRIMNQFYSSKDLRKTAQIISNMASGTRANTPAVQTNPQTGQPEYTTQGTQAIAATQGGAGGAGGTAAGGVGGAAAGPPIGMTDLALNSAKLYGEDTLKSGSIGKATQYLEYALPLIEQMDNREFGPGSEAYNRLKGFLISQNFVPVEDTNTAIREEANKYLAQWVRDNPGRTDMELAQRMKSSPNLDLTKAANVSLIKNQLGLSRMEADAPYIYQMEHPEDKGLLNYYTWKGRYFQDHDSRAFNLDLLSPEERGKLYKEKGIVRGENGQWHYDPSVAGSKEFNDTVDRVVKLHGWGNQRSAPPTSPVTAPAAPAAPVQLHGANSGTPVGGNGGYSLTGLRDWLGQLVQ